MKKTVGFHILILMLMSTSMLFAQTSLPTQTNALFSGSGNCINCHNSMTDSQANPIGIVDDWRSTMMANSSKDPYWRAKVAHEIAINPGLTAALEDKCTQCHAPAANYDAHYNGQSYTLADLSINPLARDGVTCTVCHQIPLESLGNYSGEFLMNDQHQIFGPFANPFGTPMVNNTGFTPVYSNHIKDSRICASCHTLITHSVDYSGTPTGNEFVEQSIYQEWINSEYANTGVSCQTCHVPEINEEIIISSMPAWLNTGRIPFGKHYFVGGNVFMLKLIKQFASVLGVTAETAQLDSTIALSERLLREETIDLSVELFNQTSDSIIVAVELKNKAGHKFPSGFPSRRAFVEFKVTNTNGDVIFHSGSMDSEYRIIHEDSLYEPHYDQIKHEDEVQIYEMVMADYLGNPTTVLLYADNSLKDNRLPPLGFLTSHNSYDTTAYYGNVLNDYNFNWKAGLEGSGTDRILYKFPINGLSDKLSVVTKVWYQPTHAKWLQNLFSHSDAAIDSFKTYFDASDKQPTLVAEGEMEIEILGLEFFQGSEFLCYPNPSSDVLTIRSPELIREVRLYSQSGQLIFKELGVNSLTYQFNNTNELSGVYLLEFFANDKKYQSKILFTK